MEEVRLNSNVLERIVMEVSHTFVGDADAVGTELDTYANMVVVGSQAYVFSHSGKLCNVRTFSEESSGIE